MAGMAAGLAGLLGGVGGFGNALGSSLEEQRKEQLRREQLAIEQQRADQLVEMQQKSLAQNQGQFEATQAAQERDRYAQPNDIAALMQQLGLKSPMAESMGPSAARIPASALPAILTQAAKQQEIDRDVANQEKTAAFLQQAKGQPAITPPLERAETEVGQVETPPMTRLDMVAGLTGLGHKDAGLKALMDAIAPQPKERPQPNATAQMMAVAGQIAALKEQGATLENSAELRALSSMLDAAKFVPVQEGGSIYGAGSTLSAGRTPGPAAVPAQAGAAPQPAASGPTPLIAGTPKPVAGETAQRMAGAAEARIAAQKLLGLAKDPATASYLGPWDQWRGSMQRVTPGALAGEVPPEVVDMDQALNTMNNYFINLLSGAAVSAQEAERLKGQLPKKSSRPEVFAQEVQNTLAGITRLESKVAALALHGDPKARAVADQYGIGGTMLDPSKRAEPGYTGNVVQPDMPQTPAGAGRVWIKAPDGVWGKWDASKPIPQGYTR